MTHNDIIDFIFSIPSLSEAHGQLDSRPGCAPLGRAADREVRDAGVRGRVLPDDLWHRRLLCSCAMQPVCSTGAVGTAVPLAFPVAGQEGLPSPSLIETHFSTLAIDFRKFQFEREASKDFNFKLEKGAGALGEN